MVWYSVGAFTNNAYFTFTAQEIIAGAERRLAVMEAEIASNEKALKEKQENSELWKQLQEIEDKLGLSPHLRFKSRPGSTRDSLTRGRRDSLKLTIKALKTQEPHRQYKLDLRDIEEFMLLVDEEEKDESSSTAHESD